MSEWNLEAYEYLDGYLKQVSALAKRQGDDAEDIVSGLRDHIAHEVIPNAQDQVDLDSLLAALAIIGTPEEVVISDLPLRETYRGADAVPSETAVPPYIPTGQQAPEQIIVKKRSWATCALMALLVLFIVTIIVPLLLGLAAGLFRGVSRSHEGENRAACANNLKQIRIGLHEYALRNDNVFPPLSETSGQLMFDESSMEDMLLSDPSVFYCPSTPGLSDSHGGRPVVGDHTFYYLSHAVTNEAEGLGYVDAIRSGILASGYDGDTRLALPRLNSDISSMEARRIPVMIERHTNHEPEGGNVLFLDGYVEFIKMDDKFPMTTAFIEALESIDE